MVVVCVGNRMSRVAVHASTTPGADHDSTVGVHETRWRLRVLWSSTVVVFFKSFFKANHWLAKYHPTCRFLLQTQARPSTALVLAPSHSSSFLESAIISLFNRSTVRKPSRCGKMHFHIQHRQVFWGFELHFFHLAHNSFECSELSQSGILPPAASNCLQHKHIV